MITSDYTGIRQELSDIRRKTALSKRNPVFDFGSFILIYLFFLTAVATVLLAFNIPISTYTCLYALGPTWLTLAWLRRAPIYALLITLVGVLFLVACAFCVSLIYDLRWDSNAYHKPNIGLLANGWNPFKSSMMNYSNSSGILPITDKWRAHQVDTQPKASFIIGASFYALSKALNFVKVIDLQALKAVGISLNNIDLSLIDGAMQYGKIFNIASIVACICFVTPLISESLNMRRFLAFLVVLFIALNPVTLIQAFTYYNDGFLFQILTIAAASFGYLALKPDGRYSRVCKYVGFMAIALAINIKTSALIYSFIICMFYYISFLSKARKRYPVISTFRKRTLLLLTYWIALVVVSVALLGSITYIVNYTRYGNPVYGMLGNNSINAMITGELSASVKKLPNFAQFFISLFSPSENKVFTDIAIKAPFTITTNELNEFAVVDTRMGGWGIFFSGIFSISIIIIVLTLIQLNKKNSKYFVILLTTTLLIMLPVFIMPYLWWARYYLQLFWLSSVALCCLFVPRENPNGKPKTRVLPTIVGLIISGLLVFNMYPQAKEVIRQYEVTKDVKVSIEYIKEMNEWYSMEVSLPYDEFYGLLFNLQDEGITDYNYTIELDESDGKLFEHLGYDLQWKDSSSETDTATFLRNLYDNEKIVIIAGSGDTTFSLSNMVVYWMRTLGLEFDMMGEFGSSYLAVINADGEILTEQKSDNVLEYSTVIDDISLSISSSGGLAEDGLATIEINGMDYANKQRGYCIVIYDPIEQKMVDSVRIDSYWDNSLLR